VLLLDEVVDFFKKLDILGHEATISSLVGKFILSQLSSQVLDILLEVLSLLLVLLVLVRVTRFGLESFVQNVGLV
jgi:hypothetical protein